ncbi:DUF922 domain-containing protein [Motilimonas eburnea]|uniref:DUF922 domain-containing protein n=1 Tax=Motilimonas eburnea TaxID=1737488 RepID=UPI001E3E6704|nr:DUF922 domain-containing protein [Motilimonas eburnea]MCE2571324.1 DUF922 domain-containing Zn-dependent protease [Motilimonas eburnea]
MQLFSLRVWFVLSCLLISQASLAAPEITIRYKHIGFYGQSTEAVLEQLSKQNAHFAQTRTFHNSNEWQKDWVFITEQSNKGCRISHVNTWLKADYNLPRWLDQASAPDTVQAPWHDFYQGVQDHLNGHKTIAIETLADIEKAVLKLPAQSSCDIVKAQAQALAQQMLDTQLPAKEAQYDNDTQFGLTQGAYWP